jgi:hypothetical protein
MRHVLKLHIYLCILLAFALNTQAANQPTGHRYFKNYPTSWTEIAPKGQTVFIASSKKDNINVRVVIKKQSNKNCDCNYYSIDILVNGEEILIPESLYCSLKDLTRGKVFIDETIIILMLEGGDTSTAYYKKIEFDREHVKRWAVYVDDDSLSQDSIVEETIHHVVVK